MTSIDSDQLENCKKVKLKKKTNFIKVTSSKVFKDFDLKKDFN